MTVLVDTCIVLDALQSRKPFCEDAQVIFLMAANRKIDAFITAKSLTDIYYLMRKCIHNERDTRFVLQRIITIFGVLDTQGLDCRQALTSDIEDYEDAVMVETAIRNRVDCIITRNLNDYKNAAAAVYSPQEFFEIAEQEKRIR